MKPKHTKGPWKVGSTIALRHRVIDGNANEVATMKGEFELEKQANAHLIAAAPEMLEALERILDFVDSTDNTAAYDVLHAIRVNALVAIGKARGES